MSKYQDILYHARPVSKVHPPMSKSNRAAQFSPFAALTGYDDAVRETARQTNQKIELLDEQVSILNEKILFLIEKIKDNLEITITYFIPDKKKEGGAYTTVKGIVKKIDEYNKLIIMNDGREIMMDSRFDLQGDVFSIFD